MRIGTDLADVGFVVLVVIMICLVVAAVAVEIWTEVREPEYVPLDELADNPMMWLGKKITTDGTLKWVDPAVAEDTFFIFVPIHTGQGVVIVPIPITKEYHVYTLVSTSNVTMLVASKDSLDAYLDQRVRIVGTIERMDVRKDGRVGPGYFIKVEKVEQL